MPAGLPEIDFEHIVLENCERFPYDFLLDNKPNGFSLLEPQTLSTLSDDNKKKYFQDLSKAIENDTRKYRNIKSRIKDATELALKRTKWNYKTAIPVYYADHDEINFFIHYVQFMIITLIQRWWLKKLILESIQPIQFFHLTGLIKMPEWSADQIVIG